MDTDNIWMQARGAAGEGGTGPGINDSCRFSKALKRAGVQPPPGRGGETRLPNRGCPASRSPPPPPRRRRPAHLLAAPLGSGGPGWLWRARCRSRGRSSRGLTRSRPRRGRHLGPAGCHGDGAASRLQGALPRAPPCRQPGPRGHPRDTPPGPPHGCQPAPPLLIR